MTVLSLARSTRGAWGASLKRLGPPLLFAILASGCSAPAPVPLSMGDSACEHCHMTLMDERFGSELVTATGKVYVFDSIECLASFALDFTDEVHSLWVTNFRAPSQLVRVEEAFFVKSPLLKSPMGMGLVAFGEGMTPEDAVNSFAGEVLDWDGVLGLVAVRGGSSHGHPAPESMAGH